MKCDPMKEEPSTKVSIQGMTDVTGASKRTLSKEQGGMRRNKKPQRKLSKK